MPEPIQDVIPGFNLLMGLYMNNRFRQTNSDISDLTTFQPQGFQSPSGFGITPGGAGLQGQQQGNLSSLLGQQGAGLLGGGLFNDPNFQSAFQNNDIFGAQQGAQQGLQQGIGPQAFGGLQGLFGQNQGLSNLFAQQTAQGPQDFSGGAQGGLFGAGFNAINQAGNVSGLVQQNLDASNALARPGEDRLINRFNNQEFLRTGGATSGAQERQGQLFDSLFGAQNQRVLSAQQTGLQAQQQLGQFGLGATGQGAGLLGQNLSQFNQGAGFANLFGQGAQGVEGQAFGQGLQSLQQNQSAGQQRLSNAMNLFGLGNQTFGQNFGLGLQAQGSLTDRDQMFANLFLGQQNAAANRIGATGLHAGALAENTRNQGGFLSNLFG
jgi:hypothetical protein